MAEIPTCPQCGGQVFNVLMLVAQRQTYDARIEEWTDYEHVEDETKDLEATCASCDRDCTQTLADAGVTTFYDERTLRERTDIHRRRTRAV